MSGKEKPEGLRASEENLHHCCLAAVGTVRLPGCCWPLLHAAAGAAGSGPKQYSMSSAALCSAWVCDLCSDQEWELDVGEERRQ